MAIGQRIKYFRNRKGMTQKQLGEQLGFMGKTSDVRMAQYESEARVPKIDLVKQMSQIFDVNTHALTVPDIDTHIGLMHTLFALEDMYGIKVGEIDGEMCLRIDKSVTVPGSALSNMLTSWNQQAGKLVSGEITKGEYDDWRYNYPEDLPENIINTLDHCWEKAKQENKKREKNYNPFNEPQKDLLAEFEKIKKEHTEKESKE